MTQSTENPKPGPFDIWPINGPPGVSKLTPMMKQILKAAGINPDILTEDLCAKLALILTELLPNGPSLPTGPAILHDPELLWAVLTGHADTSAAQDMNCQGHKEERKITEKGQKAVDREYEIHEQRERLKYFLLGMYASSHIGEIGGSGMTLSDLKELVDRIAAQEAEAAKKRQESLVEAVQDATLS